MLTRIDLEEAVALVTEGLAPLGTEELPHVSALGRTLAGDVRAPVDQPPFDRSPLDGYALRAADTAGASPEAPAVLEVVDVLHAGMAANLPVGPGQAARIMTGAMLPQGADCVIRQEDTDLGRETVRVYQKLSRHQNYCFRGEDYRAGDVLLPAGTRLDAGAVGVLSSAGFSAAPVLRRPRVYLVSTGDEVVSAGTAPLPAGKIYASNGPLLLARLAELGVEAAGYELVGDDPQAAAEAVRRGLERADVVLTTGGVSVGEKDIFHEVLPLLEAERVFWRVNVKPGTPVMFSRLGGKPILSLSGNPFAALVNFELLARPILAALSGEERLLTRRGSAVLKSGFGKSGGPRRFLRARWEGGAVTLPEGHSSGQLGSLPGCNCLVDVPAGSPPLRAGDRADILFL